MARIHHVQDQKIYEVNGGAYRWSVEFRGVLKTLGNFRLLRGERTRPEGNCDSQCYGWDYYRSSSHKVFISRRDRISDAFASVKVP